MGILKKDKGPSPQESYLVKRCPECFATLPIDARQCFSCKAKVGKVNRHGMAERPVNWFAYLTCILAWAALIFYIKWAFF
ncbi:MAG: hypothetical protein KGY56_02090 [Desulfobacterales bacterium]|nr:hypothetical protein [Desulfobacterales bacterium]